LIWAQSVGDLFGNETHRSLCIRRRPIIFVEK